MTRRWTTRRAKPRRTERDTARADHERLRENGHEALPWSDFNFGQEAKFSETNQENRPATSSGVFRPKAKNKTRSGKFHKRPRTSDSPANPPLANSGADQAMIGIAFGSPTHPPATVYGNLNDVNSTPLEKPVLDASPVQRDQQARQRAHRWIKLGSMFRSRSASCDPDLGQREPFYKLQTYNPVPRHATSRSTSALSSRGHRAAESVSVTYDTAPSDTEAQENQQAAKVVFPARTSSRDPAVRAPLPKLEVSIPDVHMSWHMHSRSNSISQLLLRRDKSLERLNVAEANEAQDLNLVAENGLTPRATPRRATSPASLKHTGGFSLFPKQLPSSIDGPRLPPKSPRAYLQRAVTSPARLSPMKDRFDVERPQPLRFKRMASENVVTSPGATTASTEQDAPWSGGGANETPISAATTMDEEIIFDITLFDDSRVASTIQAAVPNISPNLSTVDHLLEAHKGGPHSPASVTSTGETVYGDRIGSAHFRAIDDALAAIEDHASPATPNSLFPASQSPLTKSEPNFVSNRDVLTGAVSDDTDTTGSRQVVTNLVVRMRSRVPLGVPSPVVEVAEEPSPITSHHTPPPIPARLENISNSSPAKKYRSPSRGGTHSQKSSTSRSITEEFAPQTQPSSAMNDNAPPNDEDSDDDIPPPVPKKDRKYIPISKYALKNTAQVVKERTGIKPHQSKGSVSSTSSSVDSSPAVAAARQKAAIRAAQTSVEETMAWIQQSSSHSVPEMAPVLITSVKPVAEVAIARTISLSRKQSTKVVVSPTIPLPIPVLRNEELEPARVPEVIGLGLLAGIGEGRPDLTRADSFPAEAGEKFVEQKRCLSPVVVEAKRGHRPGVSVGLVYEHA